MSTPTLLTGLVKSWRAVSPSNTTELATLAGDGGVVGLFITTAGVINITDHEDINITLTVTDGMFIPIFAKRVRATGTTATGIFALIA